LKYDGWLGLIRIGNRLAEVITGGVHHTIENMPEGDHLLVTEWMWGTSWAQSHHRESFIVRDAGMLYGEDLRGEPYSVRHARMSEFVSRNLNPNQWIIAPYFDRSLTLEIWKKYSDYEGIVLLSNTGFGSAQQGYKIKHVVEDDYVVLSVNRGGGKYSNSAGSISCGQYKDGKLTYLVTVGGGFSDLLRKKMWETPENYIGKVCKVSGKARFASGSLRHPVFAGWREDKLPEECIFRA
jgi:ATP-dependent DNA ligase